MNVNHLHLMVPDVPAASAFFEKYFELRKANGNAGLTALLDDGGFVLRSMKVGSKPSGTYPGELSRRLLSRRVKRKSMPSTSE